MSQKDKDAYFKAKGKLLLKDSKTEYNFGVYNRKGVTTHSITDFLAKIHSTSTPIIKLYMRNSQTQEIINKIGELCLIHNKLGILDWVIKERGVKNKIFDLGDKLFDWAEQEIDIQMEQKKMTTGDSKHEKKES